MQREKLIDKVRELLEPMREKGGREVDYTYIRKELHLEPGSKESGDGLRKVFERLIYQRWVRPKGSRPGNFKVIKRVEAIQVFGNKRERRPPVELVFPRAQDTGMEMDFLEDIVLREGDGILISGASNYGKTTLAMNICGENIDKHPILMGNEYSSGGEPTPRFLNKLDLMDWVKWDDEDGMDKFTLLPVKEDWAEHVVQDRINIIDWVNIATGEHYMIGNVLESIKDQVGRGVAIVAIQKGEGAEMGRGGQFTKDFTDLELLLDKLGANETLLTLGKVKETINNKRMSGRTYGFSIEDGVRIMNFREVKKCPGCFGRGYTKEGQCSTCHGDKFVDR